MHEWLKHPLIDDYKTVSVEDYLIAYKRTFPDGEIEVSAFEGYNTIVVLSLSYPCEPVAYQGKGYGLLSRYTYGTDYHRVFERVFKELMQRFTAIGIKAEGYADISPVNERFAAYLAGLGYLGKNQFLIHPTYGTWHFLATLLIGKTIETLPYPYDTCGDCTLCIDACPTGALDDGFDKRKCTAYVTQAKEPLTMKDVEPLKTMLFGCDICQNICPKNIHAKPVKRDIFMPDAASQLHLQTLISMSNKAIQRAYADYAFAFRGGLVLKRNAFALLYHQKDYASLPLMKAVYSRHQHVDWFEQTARMIIKEMEKTR